MSLSQMNMKKTLYEMPRIKIPKYLYEEYYVVKKTRNSFYRDFHIKSK